MRREIAVCAREICRGDTLSMYERPCHMESTRINYPIASVDGLPGTRHIAGNSQAVTFPEVDRNVSRTPLDCVPDRISSFRRGFPKEHRKLTNPHRSY